MRNDTGGEKPSVAVEGILHVARIRIGQRASEAICQTTRAICQGDYHCGHA
jgi:hypothetical protein